MQVTLIGKKSLYKVVLPKVPIGNYWITDNSKEKKRRLVNIEGKDGKWQIKTDGNVNVINPRALNIEGDRISINNNAYLFSDSLILKEYSMYAISFGNLSDIYFLYCSPVFEDNIKQLKINTNSEFYIGRDRSCNIRYDNILVADIHARIFKLNGRWLIENYDRKIGTFINGDKIENGEKILSNGDVIHIAGLKIIIIGNSIFINNPFNKVEYNEQLFKEYKENQNFTDLRNDVLDDEEIEIYSDKDYFSRAPRIKNIIEKERIKIDPPPQIQDKEDMPAILVLGSSLTIGIVMIITITRTFDGWINETTSTKDTIFSLLMSFALLIGMILFPVLIQRWQKKKKIRYEKRRQKRYREYLGKKNDAINKLKDKQRQILYKNYVSVEECAQIISEKKSRLWERKIEDFDFLNIRWGIGDVPLKVDLQFPEEQFSMEDDDLVDILHQIAEDAKMIKLAPIVTSLVEKDVSSLIIRDEKIFEKIMQSIIIQLIAFHSYEDLKIVFFVKKENEKYWEYVKMLPHVWNQTKEIRFFADNQDDMASISNYLEQILKSRQENDGDNVDYKSFKPYYLIITDDYKRIENLRGINEILKCKKNFGFSLLCITNDLTQLPNECKTFISIEEDKGIIFDSEFSENNEREMEINTSYTIFFERLIQTIANIPIRNSDSGVLSLPSSYTFLEMYDVGLIEQLNILEKWKKNDPIISLKAPIGIDPSGMQIVLDVHEKAHGPHGLIAGSTGSGKSEFIITYILSMAVNYHPNDVAFLLIDYKGGGVAGAFKKNDIKLPHLVGTITNIDTNGLQRSLASIQSELKRRQVIFNEARNEIDEGTMDIYKYQKLYHNGIVKTPIPHLLIICDEFAELKQQQEEFMDELISVSRIGRSLGVHLILATQKPAGIVNDQIRSNSRFAICLKVQDREDSYDVIKKPDAAYLRGNGQFYMQVGNDDYFILGQAAWAGAPYFPSNVTKKKVDNSIEFVSNIGTPIKDVDSMSHKTIVENKGEQLTNIVKYIAELARRENIKTESLWLEDIPENIYVDSLKKKYHLKNQSEGINAIIGEYDDPYSQKQGIVDLNLSRDGNTIIYGNAESGKETLLSTIIFDLITSYSSSDLWLYILDFGSEALKVFKNSPHVGDVVFANESEKISRFFEMIQEEIKKRRAILSNYSGNYNLYIKTSKEKMPRLVVILNDYEVFAESYENDYDDLLLTITREGVKCGIIFIVTASAYNSLKYRLTQNFRRKIALQLNNDDDYYNIYDKVGKMRPSHIFGRGLVSLQNDQIYEFQTAKICEAIDYNARIENTIKQLIKNNTTDALRIPTMPDKISIEDIEEYIREATKLPIGINKKDLKLINYDFKKKLVNIITAKNIEDATEYARCIIEMLKKIKNLNIIILDTENELKKSDVEILEEFKKLLSMVNDNITNVVRPHTICLINGLDKFLNEIQDESLFYKMLKEAEKSAKYTFVIVENAKRLKNHEYDEWYKHYVDGDSGIYIGNGIDDQFLIQLSDRKNIVNNCGRSFGYVVNQGIPTLIKLVGMKEQEEENE